MDQTEKMIVSNLVCLPKGRADTHTHCSLKELEISVLVSQGDEKWILMRL